jgi:hypothetical protein
MQRPANRPLHNIREEQTHQHKDQQPLIMRALTRVLQFNGGHWLNYINRRKSLSTQ